VRDILDDLQLRLLNLHLNTLFLLFFFYLLFFFIFLFFFFILNVYRGQSLLLLSNHFLRSNLPFLPPLPSTLRAALQLKQLVRCLNLQFLHLAIPLIVLFRLIH
jgi:hypothetical protein